MQGTLLQSLVQEEPTCHGADEPMATSAEPALESPGATTTEAHAPRACAPQEGKVLQWEAHSSQLEGIHMHSRKSK